MGIDSSTDPAHNPMLYIGNRELKKVFAFKDIVFNAEIIWGYLISGVDNLFESSPVVGSIGTDGAIYIGNRNGNVYALRQDGSVKWIFLTGGNVSSSPVISASGVVYIGSEDSTVYAINSSNGVQVMEM